MTDESLLLDLLIQDIMELIRGNTMVEELVISHDLWHLHTYDINEIWLGIAYALRRRTTNEQQQKENEEKDMRKGGIGQGRSQESSSFGSSKHSSSTLLKKIDLNVPTKCLPDDPFVVQELLHTIQHSNFVISYLPTKKYRSSSSSSYKSSNCGSSSSRMEGRSISCGYEKTLDDRRMDYYMEQINYYLDLNSIGRRYIFSNSSTNPNNNNVTGGDGGGGGCHIVDGNIETDEETKYRSSSSSSFPSSPSSTNTTTAITTSAVASSSNNKDDNNDYDNDYWIKLLEMSPNNLNWIYFVLLQCNPMLIF